MNDSIINVLHLRDSPWVDGPGRTILETAAAIDPSRFNYIIGAFTSSNDPGGNRLLHAAELRNLKTFSVIERKSFDLKALQQILDYIDGNDIHIVHSHEVRSDLLGLFCAKRKNIRLATTVHGWITNNWKSRFLSKLDIFSFWMFDKIIVVSQKMKRDLMVYQIPEHKIHVLRNAIPEGLFVRDRADRSFRDKYNLTAETTLIGNIGRLSPEKGQIDFLKAAHQLLRSGHDVKFVLVGIGPDREKLERAAREYEISENVIFTGYQKDMHSVYNSLDLVVQSSYTEGMPNVILESLLLQIPVMATQVGGTEEILGANEYGLLLPPRDPRVLAQQINNFLDDPTELQSKAVKGAEFVCKEFNFTTRTEKLSEIYTKLMRK